MANTNDFDEQWHQFMQDRDLMSAVRWNSTAETKPDFTDLELDYWLNQDYFTEPDTITDVEHAGGQAQAQAQILSPPLYAAFTDRDGLQNHEPAQQSEDQAVQPNWSEAELRSVVRTLQLEKIALMSEYLDELQPWTFYIGSLVHDSDERITGISNSIGRQFNPASPTHKKTDMTGVSKGNFGRGSEGEIPGSGAKDATGGKG
ncbi:hypothetical protein OEA41_010761 [Lepraria neglecta]|uniref:Uncharacterized protein n=1 Tax=Lepraria neglecta TaxID=209136 RepID=A0AAE0DFK3_9LECA|nr:hypothetical protein OEA41_010761 [Lepraria neglecta]